MILNITSLFNTLENILRYSTGELSTFTNATKIRLSNRSKCLTILSSPNVCNIGKRIMKNLYWHITTCTTMRMLYYLLNKTAIKTSLKSP